MHVLCLMETKLPPLKKIYMYTWLYSYTCVCVEISYSIFHEQHTATFQTPTMVLESGSEIHRFNFF